jgi:hypothetical protein
MNVMKQKDNQNDFAIIHVRPGLEGKAQPVGTIAVSLAAAAAGSLVVGYAVQHSKLDNWDAERARIVAVGRAARGRKTCARGSIEKGIMRRELLIAAIQLLNVKNDDIHLSRAFRKGVQDTLARLVEAKRNADIKRSAAAAE